jgi:hypothetical protein
MIPSSYSTGTWYDDNFEALMIMMLVSIIFYWLIVLAILFYSKLSLQNSIRLIARLKGLKNGRYLNSTLILIELSLDELCLTKCQPLILCFLINSNFLGEGDDIFSAPHHLIQMIVHTPMNIIRYESDCRF